MPDAAIVAAHFDCAVAMTQGEYLAAHALIEGQAGFGQADVRALFARHGMAGEHLASLAARGNHYHRGVPEAPHAFMRLIDGDTVTMGGRPWQVIVGYGHSPEHAALADAAGALMIAGDMLLPRISTNVAVWPGEPDGDPLARFLDSLARFEALPPRHAGAAIAWTAVSRHRPARRAASRASRRHGSTNCSTRWRQRRARNRRRNSSRCCFAASSTCSSVSSRWARRSRISTTSGGAAAHSAALRPTARFATPRNNGGLPSRPPTRDVDVHPAARHNAASAPVPTYDPVALAESLASAAEKSAKLMGEFAARNAGKHAVASDELGLGKAFMELAAKMLANPARLAEGADEPVARLHEPVASRRCCS